MSFVMSSTRISASSTWSYIFPLSFRNLPAIRFVSCSVLSTGPVAYCSNNAAQLNSIKKSDNNPDLVLRVRVESGGCHGFQYIFSLKNSDTIEQRNDSIFERDGAKIVVDFTSLEILRDSTIDYTTELIGSQFKVVDSPYETSSCGCGSSFSFDPSKLNN